MRCDDCGKEPVLGVIERSRPWTLCCGGCRCGDCDRAHAAPTPEQLAKQTEFCRSMHFACRMDGLGACPICGEHLREPAE